MMLYDWDPDLAVVYGPLDTQLEGRPASDRYGVTEREELAGEPLAVALAQEEPDVVSDDTSDDQWIFVERDWNADDPMLTSYGDASAEEAAMHLEPL